MPPRTWDFRVRDILDSIGAIEGHVGDMTYDQFAADGKTIDAVLRNLTIIGEAATNVPASVQDRYPDVPWDDMRRMRNVVVHIYFGVNLPIVWQTIQGDLPPLRTQLEQVLRDVE